mmetsp:Transcript_28370/g.47686  ORF Transcript_28370/g.47686 Transcript_28370/m.47686 type:complete len:200 (+) Transcript_28370:696-1295(+)
MSLFFFFTGKLSLLQWLACHHEPHGGECSRVPALRTAPTALLQHLLDFEGTAGHGSDLLHHKEGVSGQPHAERTQLEAEGERVVGGVQRQPPGVSAVGRVQGHVPGLNQLKPHGRERLHHLLLGRHVRQPVAFFDLLLDDAVVLVVLVVFWREAPLITRKNLAWFEHAENLRVDTFSLRGMARSFDSVNTIERVVSEGV